MTSYIWGNAEVAYPDWQGTVQVDERRAGRQIDELIGLNYDAWMIIGLDIGGCPYLVRQAIRLVFLHLFWTGLVTCRYGPGRVV